MMNVGSPFNVPAGHGSANIDKAIAKFEKEAYEDNERRLQALREDKIQGEKPYRGPLAQSAGP